MNITDFLLSKDKLRYIKIYKNLFAWTSIGIGPHGFLSNTYPTERKT